MESRLHLPITRSRIIDPPKWQESLWEHPPYVQPISAHKKVYRLKHKHKRLIDEAEEEETHSPTLDEIQVRRFRKAGSNHPLYIHRLFRSPHRLKKFRKIGNVILFTIRLRTFNERMRKKRIKLFRSFSNSELGQKLQDLKLKIVMASRPFFSKIIDENNFNYQLHDKDEPSMKREKVISTLKLVTLAIKCI